MANWPSCRPLATSRNFATVMLLAMFPPELTCVTAFFTDRCRIVAQPIPRRQGSLADEMQEGLDRLPEAFGGLDMRGVPAMRYFDQRSTGNAGSELVGEGRWRRRVAQADHDQRGIADRAKVGPSIEPGERAASRGRAFRPGST